MAKNFKLKLIVVLLSFFIFLPSVASAFPAKPWKNIHREITDQALKDLGFNGKTIKKVSGANTDVDFYETLYDYTLGRFFKKKYNPTFHFDRNIGVTSEQIFQDGVRYIDYEKQEFKNYFKKCDTDKALGALGRAIHTLQDFFSHSNFVDDQNPDGLSPEEKRQAREALFDPTKKPPKNLKIAGYDPDAKDPGNPDPNDPYHHDQKAKDDENSKLGKAKFVEAKREALEATQEFIMKIMKELEDELGKNEAQALWDKKRLFTKQMVTTSAGITPTSPFYFLDSLGEKIGISLSFGAQNKAQQALKYAQEKLIEAESLVEKNQTEAAKKANLKYQEYLKLATDKIEEAKGRGKNVSELEKLKLSFETDKPVLNSTALPEDIGIVFENNKECYCCIARGAVSYINEFTLCSNSQKAIGELSKKCCHTFKECQKISAEIFQQCCPTSGSCITPIGSCCRLDDQGNLFSSFIEEKECRALDGIFFPTFRYTGAGTPQSICRICKEWLTMGPCLKCFSDKQCQPGSKLSCGSDKDTVISVTGFCDQDGFCKTKEQTLQKCSAKNTETLKYECREGRCVEKYQGPEIPFSSAPGPAITNFCGDGHITSPETCDPPGSASECSDMKIKICNEACQWEIAKCDKTRCGAKCETGETKCSGTKTTSCDRNACDWISNPSCTKGKCGAGCSNDADCGLGKTCDLTICGCKAKTQETTDAKTSFQCVGKFELVDGLEYQYLTINVDSHTYKIPEFTCSREAGVDYYKIACCDKISSLPADKIHDKNYVISQFYYAPERCETWPGYNAKCVDVPAESGLTYGMCWNEQITD